MIKLDVVEECVVDGVAIPVGTYQGKKEVTTRPYKGQKITVSTTYKIEFEDMILDASPQVAEGKIRVT
jgi:hypothetical protein